MNAGWKIGQRLITGFQGTCVTDELRSAVCRYKIGNIILFRRNIRDGEQLKNLCRELWELVMREAGLPPLIMTDEEGGGVSRLAGISGETPCPMAICVTGKTEYAYDVGKIIGKRLRSAGVNMNLAPVLDLFTDKENVSHGNRCFGDEPESAARYARAYIRGLHEEGILCVGKHFPGIGDTSVDSHLALPVVDKPRQAFEQLELVPFREAMKEGMDAIMSAHIMLPAYEKERVPATVSRSVLTDLLRKELGYSGLLMTDSMEMHGVADLFAMDEGTLRALTAGADMGMVCHDLSMTGHIHEYLTEALESGRMDAAEMDAHIERIIHLKQGLRRPEGGAEDLWNPSQEEQVRSIMREAVGVFCAAGSRFPVLDQNTVYAGDSATMLSQAGDMADLIGARELSRMLGGCWKEVSELEAMPLPKVCVMVVSRPGDPQHLTDHAAKLLEAGVQVIAVSMHVRERLNGFPGGVWKMAAWQYDMMSLEVLAKQLKKLSGTCFPGC